MKAFVYDAAHRLDRFAITRREVAEPVVRPKDLLVSVKAFSFNPVDYKIRQNRSGTADGPVILGWDAAGVVESIGAEVQGFHPGDAVYYAGDLGRAGSYAERQAVDHRLVGHMPTSLDFPDAAALPLTALTAYEALMERGIDYRSDTRVLIIGAGGGVGSIAIQLIKAVTEATVIAVASRAETIAWVRELGADQVVGRDLVRDAVGHDEAAVHVVLGTTHTQDYLPIMPGLLHPFGHLAVIDDPDRLDIRHFKSKALSVHWEFMFAKSSAGYRLESQGWILNTLAKLVDSGKVRTTRRLTFSADEANLHKAHTILESGTSVGKMVMQW